MVMGEKINKRAKHWHAVIKRSLWRFVAAFFGLAGALTFVRDEFLSPERQAKLKMPQWLPAWPWYWWVIAALVGVIVAILEGSYREHRDQEAALKAAKAHPHDAKIDQAPQIEFLFGKRAPYEVSNIEKSHVLSTVRIGVRNSGGGTLSNCRVSIEKIAPEAAISLPMRLLGEGFRLRHDDTEELVTIANRYDHVDKYGFHIPRVGGFYDVASIGYLDAATPRTIVVRVVATECERSGTFKIWNDKSKAVHLEFLGYAS